MRYVFHDCDGCGVGIERPRSDIIVAVHFKCQWPDPTVADLFDNGPAGNGPANKWYPLQLCDKCLGEVVGPLELNYLEKQFDERSEI